MKHFLSLVIFFATSLAVVAQQFATQGAIYTPDFSAPLASGIYVGCDSQGAPITNWNCYHLFTMRNDDLSTNRQLQLSSNFGEDDRFFFRKIFHHQELTPKNTPWHEIATRGNNIFTGNQDIIGNISGNSLQLDGDINLGKDVGGENDLGYGNKMFFLGKSTNSDPLWMARYNAGTDHSDLRVNIGDCLDPNDRFVVGTTHYDGSGWKDFFAVTAMGDVGIGVPYPTQKFEVNGTIRAKEVKIENTNWPDYVFSKNYILPTLSEVSKHIEENNHLPGIPSAKEVAKDGINLSEMNAKLLQKIEELTLYIIQQQKEFEVLRRRVDTIEQK